MKKIIIGCIFLILSLSGVYGASSEPLPGEGSGRSAIRYDYFPSRMYAFVFRNWTTVPVGRLAKVLHTTPAKVSQLAQSMGLSAQRRIESEWLTSRGYITVLRHNWHLLPYDQLVELLGITREELATRLRDDDFLWVKLGNQKPSCELLYYTEPTAPMQQQAAQLASWMEELGDELSARQTPRFSFVEEFRRPDRSRTARASHPDSTGFNQRVIFSYVATFGDPLLDPSLNSYPEGLLQQLSREGVNGIWLHTVLRTLVPEDGLFPGDEKAALRIRGLQRLVDRAARYGIKIYLYLNEPRGMAHTFFASSPQREALGGVQEGDMQAFCTSDPAVLDWLTRSVARVFGEVKGLGGAFTITASENLTSCASHGAFGRCPRCREHSFADLIVGVNRAIAQGVQSGNPEATVWVWDWGWIDSEAEAIISRLPKCCALMSVSEWSMPIERGGIASTVGEYSLSAVGPGPRALRHWQWAREAGLRCVAKVQVNASWEMAAVPAIPVLELVADHAEHLARESVDGVMLSWSVGGYPSANLSLFQRYRQGEKAQQLDALAEDFYGAQAVEAVRKAWSVCSEAYRSYPYHIQTLYHGPQHMGVANLVYTRPTGYTATMVGIPYDDMKSWISIYPLEVWSAQMERVAQGFEEGAGYFEEAARRGQGVEARRLHSEWLRSQVIAMHLRSSASMARFVAARDQWLQTHDRASLPLIHNLLQGEKERVRKLLPLVREDATIGYEASNHYFYLPVDLWEKYLSVRYAEQFFEQEAQRQ
ncbi:MAG: hypothetical protein PHV49_00905 [Alistipes sp.]|nr:hypothetical protein [Alistipes sp.]